MTIKKYIISLDGLLSHESIIFKLICSVSERSKNRDCIYSLATDEQKADIYINDIKNKPNNEVVNTSLTNVWVTDTKNKLNNSISRPLIATRVLHTLDDLMKNISPIESHEDVKPKIENKTPSYDLSEEDASELAIVHDEVLENPANNENTSTPTNIELTLVKNEGLKPVLDNSGLRRVLVVDDSPSVRKQLELEIDLFDVLVDFADCAKAAFELLKSNNYNLALLDVVLPDKDGFLICKHVKATAKDTVVIMLTGKATQADKIKGALAGCNDYLIKPVGRATFQNAVKAYIPIKETNTAIEA